MASFYSIIVFVLRFILFQSKFISFEFRILPRNNTLFQSYLNIKFESIEQLCIGTPYQCFKFYFEPNTIYSWVINHNIDRIPIQNRFYDNLSSTFKLAYHGVYTLYSNHLFEGIKFIDNIKIGDFETNDTFIFLGNKMAKELINPVIGLQIGLNFSSSPSFLEELFKHKDVNSLEYTFEYLSSSKGRITFGHNKQLLMNPNLEIELETNRFLPYVVGTSANIYFGSDPIMNTETKVGFEESMGYIQFPERYQKQILTSLFGDKLHFLCILMRHKRILNKDQTEFFYYVCDKQFIKQNQRTFPELKFSFPNGSLILNKRDMFIDYDDNNMLLTIVFIDYTSKRASIIIGEPILKYYKIKHQYNSKGRLVLELKYNSFLIKALFSLIICLSGLGIIITKLIFWKNTSLR